MQNIRLCKVFVRDLSFAKFVQVSNGIHTNAYSFFFLKNGKHFFFFLFMNNRRLNCTCDFIKQLNVMKDIDIDIEIDGWCTYPKYLKDREIK